MQSIEQKIDVPGGFLFPSQRLSGYVYVLTGSWQDDFKKHIDGSRVIGIRLSKSMGWEAENLDFLSQLAGLRTIEIFNWDVKDISILEQHQQIESISLECAFKKFDFSKLTNLRYSYVRWRPGAETLFHCTGIEYLQIDNYPFEDFTPLRELKNINNLNLLSRKLVNCTGIESLSNLEKLTLSYCTSFGDIMAIGKSNNLREINFTSCKKVNDVTDIGKLHKLTKLLMENCVSVSSVKPLLGCTALQELYLIGMSIDDGDLSPLLEIKNLQEVAIAKKRHHSHTSQEINDLLSMR